MYCAIHAVPAHRVYGWVGGRGRDGWGGLTLLGATALDTKWYLCMALTHWQMDVQALETFEMASGVKSSLSMYGWILAITWSGMWSWK